MTLLRLTQDAGPPWLSHYSPSLARVALVPDQGTGPRIPIPIPMCLDFLLAASPLIRSLLPEDHPPCPCQPLHILLPDVCREDLLTALQVVSCGSSAAITGVVATNKKLLSVTKILKTLGVQISLAFDFHSHCALPLEIEENSINLQSSSAQEVVSVGCQTLEDTGARELPVLGTDNQFLENFGSMEQSSGRGAECTVQWQVSGKLGNSLQHCPEMNLQLAQDLVTEVEEESIEDLLEDSDVYEEAENTSLMCGLCRKTFTLSEELLGHQEECRGRNIIVGLQEGNKQETAENNSNSHTVTCCVYCKETLPFEELLLHRLECTEKKGQVGVGEVATLARPHKCPVCGHGSKISANLLEHMETHRSSSHIHRCQECNKTFKAARHARKHMKIKHNQEVLFCFSYDCTSSFRDRESFNKHRKEVHETGVKCRIKNKQQICDEKLKKGNLKKNRESKTNCNVCNKSFKYPRNVTKHMRKVHNIKNFACSTPGCGAILETKESAMQHRKDFHKKAKLMNIKAANESKEEENPIEEAHILLGKCDVCNKEFTTAANARTHKVGFHSTRVVSCYLCNVTFKWKQSLQLHIKKVHKSDRFLCSSIGCYALFENKETLRQHKREMHSVLHKKTVCGTRKFQSIQEESLGKKKVGSMVGKKYKCNVCKKGYKSYQSLRYHNNKFHSKIYRCKYNCGEKFKELLEMKEHSATCGLTDL